LASSPNSAASGRSCDASRPSRRRRMVYIACWAIRHAVLRWATHSHSHLRVCLCVAGLAAFSSTRVLRWRCQAALWHTSNQLPSCLPMCVHSFGGACSCFPQ
jgi:hypothetical protein